MSDVKVVAKYTKLEFLRKFKKSKKVLQTPDEQFPY